jgi:hypothetical protein
MCHGILLSCVVFFKQRYLCYGWDLVWVFSSRQRVCVCVCVWTISRYLTHSVMKFSVLVYIRIYVHI